MFKKKDFQLYKEVLPLYITSEFRAQGLIPKGTVGRIILIVGLLISSPLFIMYIQKYYNNFINNQNDLLHVFIFSIVIFIFILNSFSVNSLTLPEEDRKLNYLFSYPIPRMYHKVTSICISIIRGYILNFCIMFYVFISLIITNGLNKSLFVSLIYFLIFPILPSLLSNYMADKISNVNIQLYLISFMAYIFLGSNIIPLIDIKESMFLNYIGLPLTLLFGEGTLYDLCIVMSIWIVTSLILIQLILNSHTDKNKHNIFLSFAKSILNNYCNKYTAYTSIMISRIRFLNILLSCLISFICVITITIFLGNINFRSMFVLAIYGSIFLSLIISVPLIALFFPDKNYLSSLRYLPMNINEQIKIAVLNIILIIYFQFILIFILSNLIGFTVNFYVLFFTVFSSVNLVYMILSAVFSIKKLNKILLILIIILIKLIFITLVLINIRSVILTMITIAIFDFIIYFITSYRKEGNF